MAHLNKYDRVLDAYCGMGTIALSVADMCKEVIGVEINNHSIRNAINNVKYNNIKNAYFIADDCTNYMNCAANQIEYLIQFYFILTEYDLIKKQLLRNT